MLMLIFSLASMLAEFSSSCIWRRRSAFSPASILMHDDSLVLLNLGLDLVELLNLLLHLSISILVLLLQSNNGGLLLDLSLLQVSSQLGDLSLSLLVKLNLSAGGTASLIKTFSKVF